MDTTTAVNTRKHDLIKCPKCPSRYLKVWRFEDDGSLIAECAICHYDLGWMTR